MGREPTPAFRVERFHRAQRGDQHGHLVGAVHDVVVGDDVTLLAEQKAAAAAGPDDPAQVLVDIEEGGASEVDFELRDPAPTGTVSAR